MTGSPRIAIVGDYSDLKETHRATNAEMSAAGADYTWMPTTAVGDPALTLADFDGLLIASGSTYESMDGALAAIRFARGDGAARRRLRRLPARRAQVRAPRARDRG